MRSRCQMTPKDMRSNSKVSAAISLGIVLVTASAAVAVTDPGARFHPASISAVSSSPQTASGLTRSGRWFLYNGAYVYLAGIDAQELVADPAYDSTAVLDKLQAYRINKLRIWIDAWFGGPGYLRPWHYDGQTGRFDLDTWNDAYWDRLQAFAAAAWARDIIIEASIFDAYPRDADPDGWWLSPRFRQAWNKAFNSNGAFSTNLAGHFYPDFYSLDGSERSSSGKTLYEYQQALVDKVIGTFAQFPNVYYEIDNEFPGNDTLRHADVYSWQLYWAWYVRQRSGKLVDVHAGGDRGGPTGGVQLYWDQPYVDGIDFHLYEQIPDTISSLLHDAQRKGKILQCNESYGWYSNNAVDMERTDNATREAWAWFVSGGYYAFFNGHRTQYTGWETMASRIKVLRDLVDQVQWWRMSPVDRSGREYDGLASQGPTRHWQILADPGSQYVVYYWNDGSDERGTRDARMRLPHGEYRYRWYDPATGEMLSSGTIAGGTGRAAVPAPPATWNKAVGVVLFIQR